MFRTVPEFTMEIPPTGLKRKKFLAKGAGSLSKCCGNLFKNYAYCFKIPIRKNMVYILKLFVPIKL